MRADYIWMNGEMVPFDQATVHFMSPTLHYGFGGFEGIRCYNTPKGPGIFRNTEHLQRFLDTAHIMGVQDFPYTLDELHTATHETVKANNLTDCYVRPAFYMMGGLGLNMDAYSTEVGIAAWEWGAYLGEEALEKGVRMAVSSLTRLHPNVHPTKAKAAGNYVNSIMAKTLAHRTGFDDAIMLDPEGYVSEGSGMNLFVVRNEVIYTPYRATILEGITRASVITIAKDLGYTLVEEPLVRDQLYIADEIFCCGTAAEVTAVREVDTRQIGAGKMGPITREIQQAFFKTVRGAGERSDEWLDYIS
jgi:branched-chain amino acid aminotransferase